MAISILEATYQAPVATHGVVMDSVNYDSWLTLTGNVNAYAYVPDETALDITGDLEIVVRAALTDWTTGANQRLVSKRDSLGTAGPYEFFIDGTGYMNYTQTAFSTCASTVVAPFTDGVCYWMKVTRATATGTVQFFYAPDADEEPIQWTQLGADRTVTSGALTSNSSRVAIGSINGLGDTATGKVWYVSVRNEIATYYGSAVVLSIDFGHQTPGVSSFVCGSGQTVTVSSPASITQDPNPWRFAVEALVASGGARVGASRVDVAKVSAYEWFDITADLLGVEVSRGKPPTSPGYPRPDTGVCSFSLDNSTGRYSAWKTDIGTVTDTNISTTILNREWNNAKTIFRVVMFKANATGNYLVSDSFLHTYHAHWVPRFTGYLEDWKERIELGRNVVTVTAIETVAYLANIERTPVAAYGASDTLAIRLYRLLVDANSPFYVKLGIPTTTFTNPVYALQATTGEQNRLVEIQNACMSVNASLIWSDTDGNYIVGYGSNARYTGASNTATLPETILRLSTSTQTVAADVNNFPKMVTAQISNVIEVSVNADWIVNTVTVTNTGGTAQTSTTNESIGAYGLRTLKLDNMWGVNDWQADYTADLIILEMDAYTNPSTFPLTADIPQNLTPGAVTIADQHRAQRAMRLNRLALIDWYPTGNTNPAVRFMGRMVQLQDNFIKVQGGMVWTTKLTMLPRYNYEIS